MASTVIRIGNDSFTTNSLIHESHFQATPTQNVNSSRQTTNSRVVHSRSAFSNITRTAMYNGRNSSQDLHNSSSGSSSSFASFSANRSSTPSSFSFTSTSSSSPPSGGNTPLTPVRVSIQTEESVHSKSPHTRYVQQCRSIARQLQLTPSNFKKHRLMHSPIVTSKTQAAERKRYQEMLESVFNDSLEYSKHDNNSISLNKSDSSEVANSSGDDSTPSPAIRKVGTLSKVNKARRRFRF